MEFVEHRMEVRPAMSWYRAEDGSRHPIQKCRVFCACGWKGPLCLKARDALRVRHAGGIVEHGVQLGMAV